MDFPGSMILLQAGAHLPEVHLAMSPSEMGHRSNSVSDHTAHLGLFYRTWSIAYIFFKNYYRLVFNVLFIIFDLINHKLLIRNIPYNFTAVSVEK
jgi:hypothetical protein